MAKNYWLLLLTLLALMLAACGGGGSSVAPEPRTEATTAPAPATAAVLPTNTATPVGQRESPQPPTAREGSSVASVPATEVPQPTLPDQTAEPTPAAVEQATEPAPTTATAPLYVELTSVPCVDDFRQTLLNYDGPEEFGPEVAQRLSDEFRERRTDCAEQGWNPGFPVETAGQVHGVDACFRQGQFRLNTEAPAGSGKPVNSSFTHELGFKFALKPTMMFRYEDVTSLLVHLSPLPFDPDAGGCWYSFAGGGWWWTHFAPARGWWDTGFDHARFPECEALLRSALGDLWISGEMLDLDGVASAKASVVVAMPEVCAPERGDPWDLFPQAEPRAGCAVEAPTGVQPDTSLVINWHPSFPDAFGGSACWVYSPEGEWSFYAAADGGG